MRSFAIWCKKNEQVEINPEIEVHVNHWSQVSEKNDTDYCFMDFGIKVINIDEIDSLFLYCPFEVDKSDISDLGCNFNGYRIANSIFNENYSVTVHGEKRFSVYQKGDKFKKTLFVCYALSENEYNISKTIKVNDKRNSSIICIKLATWKDKTIDETVNTYYIRFRVKIKFKDIMFVKELDTTESAFSDKFTRTEIIDFRLNDIRSMCKDGCEEFSKGDKCNIKAIHYLLMRRANDRIIVDGKCEYKVRMLEDEIWEKYISELKTTTLAYHFKKFIDNDSTKESIDDFNILVRVQSQKSVNKWWYVGIVIFLGILSNTIFSLGQYLLKIFLGGKG